MARPLRICYPGAFYHITARGNERKAIFNSNQDRVQFLSYLETARKRYRAYVHAEVTESPLKKVYGQVILGTEHFIEQSCKLIKGDISTEILARKQMQEVIEPPLIISSVAKSFGVDEAVVWGTGKRGENAARNAAMYIMKRYRDLGNNEIGKFFGGLHYRGVSKICTRLGIQMDKDKQLGQMVNEAISRIKDLTRL